MSDDPRPPLPDLTSEPCLDAEGTDVDATRVHSAPAELLDAMRRHAGAESGPSGTTGAAESLPSVDVDLDELGDDEPTPCSARPEAPVPTAPVRAAEARPVRLLVALAVALLSAVSTACLLRYLER